VRPVLPFHILITTRVLNAFSAPMNDGAERCKAKKPEGGTMFEGFALSMIDTGEAVIRVRHAGSGPPLLLLHGHPQTHVMWHKIAPRLAQHFTVVAADLRGYGDSSKPSTMPNHAPYSKRTMARDQIEVMRQLGFDQFFVAGHDRGGRCAYRTISPFF
jgi:haloacetate dehalogenase